MGAAGCKSDCGCDQENGENDIRAIMSEERKEVVDMSSVLSPPGRGAVSDDQRTPFEVPLVRTGDHWRTLGMLVSPDDDPKVLVIDDVWEPSLIHEWNQRQQSERTQVKKHHLIVSVNGISGDAEGMLATIQASGKGTTLRMVIKPPEPGPRRSMY